MRFTASQVFAQTNPDRKAEAEKVMQQGRDQLQTGQFTAALQSWQQALLISREIKDRQGEGKTLVNLGLAYHFLGNYRKAIEYYQQSLPILREIKDSKTEGIALYNFGNTYDSLGDYHKAIEYHQQSLKIAQEIKDREGEGAVFGGLGNAYYSLGDYPKAIEYHQMHVLMLSCIYLIEGSMMTDMSKRIQVTLPDRLADDLEKWATYDGRPLSNLAAYLLERAVAEAKKEGAEWSKENPGSK